MNLGMDSLRSLKGRIALVTLAMSMLSVWWIGAYVSKILRDEMAEHLGRQQFSSVSVMAAHIDHEMATRKQALESVAAVLDASLLANHAVLQAQMEAQPVFKSLFNGGILVLNADGTVAAGLPYSKYRFSENYADSDYLIGALRDGVVTIGQPAISKIFNAPMIGMAAPIRDRQRRPVGAVVGIIDLQQKNFLDVIAETSYGRTGGYLLISPQHKLFVSATDKSRVLHKIPEPGINPMLDRYLGGFEGYGQAVNSRGIDEISAAKQIPTTDWFVVGVLPTAEAFEPVRHMQIRVIIATLLLSVLTGVMIWFLTAALLRGAFAPMLAARTMLENLAQSNQVPQHLPVRNNDEIGKLIASFNHMLDIVARQASSLKASEQKLWTLFESIDAMIFIKDREGRYQFANRPVRKLFNVTMDELIGVSDEKFFDPQTVAKLNQHDREVMDKGITVRTEETLRNTRDGSLTTYLSTKVPLRDEHGEVYALCGIATDISERKLMEEKLSLAASVFTHAYEGITLTSPDGIILDVNESCCRITGYRREEVLGQHVRIFRSGRHDHAFYEGMWQAITTEGYWQGEIWNRRENGEIYPELKTISAVRDEHGNTVQYLAMFSDITERKQLEEQVRQLAFYDPLTKLPNRRLLEDRLGLAIAASRRTAGYVALMFLDLDNFKPINDNHGHKVGDLLLEEVAVRLKSCVREIDTVARFGGDEFVVVVGELGTVSADARRQAETLAQKLLETVSEPYLLPVSTDTAANGTGGSHAGAVVRHVCSASIGVSLFLGSEAGPEEVLRRSDAAMYQAKSSGRHAICFFDSAQPGVSAET